MRQQLSARDRRMAKTICIMCLAFLICNMPKIVYMSFGGKDYNDQAFLWVIFSSLFWAQCSFNFVIYAASNKQFREAYFMFVRVAVFHLTEDPYRSTVTSNRGTNSKWSRAKRKHSSNNGSSSRKSGKLRFHRDMFDRKHPASYDNISQKSEPCPGIINQKPKRSESMNASLLLSELPSQVVTN